VKTNHDRPPCSGVTAAGHPCTRHATDGTDFCGWHDPQRRRLASRAKTPKPTKVCRSCQRELPRRLFPATGGKSPVTGERYGGARCSDCLAKERRANGIPVRHQRRNARGDVWCNRCRRYLSPDRFTRHPQRPHTYWSYCRDCVHVIDRERYHRTKFRADKAAGAFERTRRKARRRDREHRERGRFVAGAIDTLRRRGFTKSEVARLARVSMSQLYGWLDFTQRPTPAIEARFGELLVATAHLPMGIPPFRRRLPHPELERLLSATDGLEERYPTRDRWRKQRELRAIGPRADEDLAA
jgi:hypothetical protein